MEGVDFLRGMLFPFINFALFLGVLIYLVRKPFHAFAVKRHTDFNAQMREASTEVQRMGELEEQLATETAHIDRDLTDIERQAYEGTARDSVEIEMEAKRIADQIEVEARQVADAFVVEMRVALRREILRTVEGRLRSTLSRHQAESDAYADSKLKSLAME